MAGDRGTWDNRVMKINTLAHRLQIELTDEQFDILLALPTRTVLEELEALRFYKVDYDSHFGACILVTHDTTDKGMRQKLRRWVQTRLVGVPAILPTGTKVINIDRTSSNKGRTGKVRGYDATADRPYIVRWEKDRYDHYHKRDDLEVTP
jgi:long-subunit acyl-CoA synthetase (AMP-forming)